MEVIVVLVENPGAGRVKGVIVEIMGVVEQTLRRGGRKSECGGRISRRGGRDSRHTGREGELVQVRMC